MSEGGTVLWVTCPGSHRFGPIAGRRSGVDIMPAKDYCPVCERVTRCRQDGSVGKHKRQVRQSMGRIITLGKIKDPQTGRGQS